MASYALVYSAIDESEDKKPIYAVVASDSEVHYVFSPDSAYKGLDDERIQRLLKVVKTPPATEEDWMKLALSNTGYVYADAPVAVSTLPEAVSAAKQNL